MKTFADDELKITKVKAKFLLARNIVGKRENTRIQHFLVSQQCVQNLCISGSFKARIVWQRVNLFPKKPWFLRVCSMSFENTAGKRQIGRKEQFFLFPQCCLPASNNLSKLKMSSANSLEESKICPFGKEQVLLLKEKIISHVFRKHKQ